MSTGDRRLAVRICVGIVALALALAPTILGSPPPARADGPCLDPEKCVVVVVHFEHLGNGEVYSSDGTTHKVPGLDCTRKNGLTSPAPCTYGWLFPEPPAYPLVDVTLHYAAAADSYACTTDSTDPADSPNVGRGFDHPGTYDIDLFDLCLAVPVHLTVDKSGTGNGKITSSNSAINCGQRCGLDVATGRTIKLRATAKAGSHFVRWSGLCSGTKPDCSVALDFSASAKAVFDTNPPPTPRPSPTIAPTPSPPPPTLAPTLVPAPSPEPSASPTQVAPAPTPGPSPTPAGSSGDQGIPTVLLVVALAVILVGGLGFGLLRRSRTRPSG